MTCGSLSQLPGSEWVKGAWVLRIVEAMVIDRLGTVGLCGCDLIYFFSGSSGRSSEGRSVRTRRDRDERRRTFYLLSVES